MVKPLTIKFPTLATVSVKRPLDQNFVSEKRLDFIFLILIFYGHRNTLFCSIANLREFL